MNNDLWSGELDWNDAIAENKNMRYGAWADVISAAYHSSTTHLSDLEDNFIKVNEEAVRAAVTASTLVDVLVETPAEVREKARIRARIVGNRG